MFFSVEIPYTKPGSLPSPIPTAEEIQNSTDVLSDQLGQRLVVVGLNYVVRYGAATVAREAFNLIFAEEHVGIPVPRVYAIFRDGTGCLYIVMERIIGFCLQNIWLNLTETFKTNILGKLQTILKKMHDFPTENPCFYGSVDGKCVPHDLFWTKNKDSTLSGPFTSEHDFNMGLVLKLRNIWALNGKHSYRADFYEANVNDVLQNHRPTFTHADIQRKNIMIRSSKHLMELGEEDFEEDLEVVIVDWEDAGWYPSYWEYFAAFTTFTWEDDWQSRIESAIRPWVSETALAYMIYRDIWF